MNQQFAGNGKILTFCLITGGLIALIDGILDFGHSASLLFTLVFWVSVVEGAIALVAATDISGSPWIRPIKKELLSLYPLLLLFTVLFLFLFPKLEFYPWVKEQGKWLNKNFFMIRNIVILLVVFVLARKFAMESINENPDRNFYAVIYLFAFVISQSMIAFDWVMSLEYPWVSTLLGGYFFIEALFTGIALSGILLFIIYKKSGIQKFAEYKKVLKDIANLLFGFSLMWAGLFYAQYLVIWYGHIPEESSFFIHRLAHPPYRQLIFLIIPMLFVIPFVVLLSKKVKGSPTGVLSISLVVLAGILIERIVIIGPLAPINYLILIPEFIGIGFLVNLALKSTDLPTIN